MNPHLCCTLQVQPGAVQMVVETLEQVLLCNSDTLCVSASNRFICKYTLGNKGLLVAILGNHTYKVTVGLKRRRCENKKGSRAFYDATTLMGQWKG